MLDAVGNVRRQAHLCLHLQVGSRGALLQALQQLQSCLTMTAGVGIVVHHIQGHEVVLALGVAHHERQFQQLGRNIRVFDAEQHLLFLRMP